MVLQRGSSGWWTRSTFGAFGLLPPRSIGFIKQGLRAWFVDGRHNSGRIFVVVYVQQWWNSPRTPRRRRYASRAGAACGGCFPLPLCYTLPVGVLRRAHTPAIEQRAGQAMTRLIHVRNDYRNRRFYHDAHHRLLSPVLSRLATWVSSTSSAPRFICKPYQTRRVKNRQQPTARAHRLYPLPSI